MNFGLGWLNFWYQTVLLMNKKIILFTFTYPENKHDFHFVVQMKQKLDNRKKAI